MIEGIGVDIVDKKRFDRLIKEYDDRIALKILSSIEYEEYKDVLNKIDYLSKKFAAKEAFSKALGTGLYRKGIFPKLITISHNNFGKPIFKLSKHLESIILGKYRNIQLSISDTDSQSIAFVTIER